MSPYRVPDVDRQITLYRLFSEDNDLLYIGQTVDFDWRLSNHRKEKSWGPRIHHWTVETLPDRARALQAERIAILRELPHYNTEIRNPWKMKTPMRTGDTYALGESLRVAVEAGEMTYRQAFAQMKACDISTYKAAHLLGLSNTYIDPRNGWTRRCWSWGVDRLLEHNGIAE